MQLVIPSFVMIESHSRLEFTAPIAARFPPPIYLVNIGCLLSSYYHKAG